MPIFSSGNISVSNTPTVDTELPAAALLADNTATPTAPAVGAFNMVYDGATWDMWRGTSTTGAEVNVVKSVGVSNRSTMAHAVVDIPTAGTRVQLATQAVPDGFKVVVKAHPSNGGGLVYVGDSTVASTTGIVLAAGDSVALAVTNVNIIWVDTNTSGNDVCWIVET